MIKIFDLDGTIINSVHRKCTLPDGTLDLAHWIDNNTAELVALDTLLPLVQTMRDAWKNEHTIVVCTARVLSDFDYAFFLENDIMFHYMLARPEGCTMSDYDLKDIQLRIFAQNQGYTWKRFCEISLFYDDCQKVINRMVRIGINTIDANKQNRLLKWASQ